MIGFTDTPYIQVVITTLSLMYTGTPILEFFVFSSRILTTDLTVTAELLQPNKLVAVFSQLSSTTVSRDLFIISDGQVLSLHSLGADPKKTPLPSL
jgi:hypothetical protein